MDRVELDTEAYQAEVGALVTRRLSARSVPLAAAEGRVLADDVLSPVAMPLFTNSAMDGFAVRHADVVVGQPLRVVAVVAAGDGTDPAFGTGECVRIMTGAPLPSSADTVVPVELTTPGTDEQSVVVLELPPAGRHVRRPGDDLPEDALLGAAGEVVTPGRLALLTAVGLTEVAVVRRPIVGVGATGDELRGPGRELARGEVYESNAHMLGALLRRDGARVRTTTLPDDVSAFRVGLAELAGGCDLVVLTGGVSVGDFDVVRNALAHGHAAFRHVRMQPGRPQGWARLSVGERAVPVVALPGNPFSALVSYELFARPLVHRLLGRPEPEWVGGRAGAAWGERRGRVQVARAYLAVLEDGLRVSPLLDVAGRPVHGVQGLAADALVRVGEDVVQVLAGDRVLVRRLT